jgi:hypothetical protein
MVLICAIMQLNKLIVLVIRPVRHCCFGGQRRAKGLMALGYEGEGGKLINDSTSRPFEFGRGDVLLTGLLNGWFAEASTGREEFVSKRVNRYRITGGRQRSNALGEEYVERIASTNGFRFRIAHTPGILV